MVDVGRALHAKDALLVLVGQGGRGVVRVVADGHHALASLRGLHRRGEEGQLVRELPHAQLFEPADALSRVARVHLVDHLNLLAGGGHLGHVRHRHQRAREDGLVARLGPLDHLAAEDDVERARHAPRRHLARILLHAHALPVDELGVVVAERPLHAVRAGRVLALGRLRVLELLHHRVRDRLAQLALEHAMQQLGAHVGGARDGAREGGERGNLVGA